ncbi:MAG: hypothetical protein ACXABV_02105 [Candidatus Thorarchaeota archaeon]|jgi:hypothetical protein
MITDLISRIIENRPVESLKNISAISKERMFAASQGQTFLIPNVTLTEMMFAC